MLWPDGYGGDETSNAAWVATGRPKMISDPPLPQVKARSEYWMKPEQGTAVRLSLIHISSRSDVRA